MYYSGINKFDIANGPGIRVSLFVSGCNLKCPGCFNPEAHSFINGKEYTKETQDKIISMINKPYIRGLSILGGDPMCQKYEDIENFLIPLAEKVHELNKDVWLWTGFTWEELMEGINSIIHTKPHTVKKILEKFQWQSRNNLIMNSNVIVEGRFEEDKKDITLPYCGSTNQRVIDINSTKKHYYEDKIIDLFWENKV